MNYALLSLLLLVSCVAAPSSPELPKSKELWLVASDLDNAPFAWLSEHGDPMGRDVEMMERVAELCDARIEWTRMPFHELLDAVREGQADIVCATMGITEARSQIVAFTRPYFETEIAVVLRNGFGSGQALAPRLAGSAVHAARGTTSELAAAEHLPLSELLLENKDDRSGAELLLSGEVDALVMDGPAARAVVERSRNQFVLTDEPLATESYALALARDRNDDLAARLNRALRALEEQGDLNELDSKYRLKPRTESR